MYLKLQYDYCLHSSGQKGGLKSPKTWWYMLQHQGQALHHLMVSVKVQSYHTMEFEHQHWEITFSSRCKCLFVLVSSIEEDITREKRSIINLKQY